MTSLLLVCYISIVVLVFIICRVFLNKINLAWIELNYLYNKVHNVFVISLYNDILKNIPEKKQKDTIDYMINLNMKVILEKNIVKRVENEKKTKKYLLDLIQSNKYNRKIEEIYSQVNTYIEKIHEISKVYKRLLMIFNVLTIFMFYIYFNNNKKCRQLG